MAIRALLVLAFIMPLTMQTPSFADHSDEILYECDKFMRTAGARCYRKFGKREDVQSGSIEDIWNGPTGAYNWPPAASIMYVSSSSADDTSTLSLHGLDADWEIATEEIVLAGKTFVATETELIRIWRLKHLSGDGLVGEIYLSHSDTDTGGDGVPDELTTIHAYIAAGEQGTEQVVFSTPADYECAIADIFAGIRHGSGIVGSVGVTAKTRAFGGTFREIARLPLSTGGTSAVAPPILYPQMWAPKTDIVFAVETSMNNTDVGANFTAVCLACEDCNP